MCDRSCVAGFRPEIYNGCVHTDSNYRGPYHRAAWGWPREQVIITSNTWPNVSRVCSLGYKSAGGKEKPRVKFWKDYKTCARCAFSFWFASLRTAPLFFSACLRACARGGWCGIPTSGISSHTAVHRRLSVFLCFCVDWMSVVCLFPSGQGDRVKKNKNARLNSDCNRQRSNKQQRQDTRVCDWHL